MAAFFAYIDPFTGSLVLQLLGMAFAAAMLFFKKIKTAVLGLFGMKTTIESIGDTENIQTISFENNKDNEQQKAA